MTKNPLLVWKVRLKAENSRNAIRKIYQCFRFISHMIFKLIGVEWKKIIYSFFDVFNFGVEWVARDAKRNRLGWRKVNQVSGSRSVKGASFSDKVVKRTGFHWKWGKQTDFYWDEVKRAFYCEKLLSRRVLLCKWLIIPSFLAIWVPYSIFLWGLPLSFRCINSAT